MQLVADNWDAPVLGTCASIFDSVLLVSRYLSLIHLMNRSSVAADEARTLGLGDLRCEPGLQPGTEPGTEPNSLGAPCNRLRNFTISVSLCGSRRG